MDNLGYLAIFCVFLYMITRNFLHKIRKYPPTPFINVPIIGHLYLLRIPLHKAMAKISARYGPIVYLEFGSRPILLVSSPSAVEECLTTNDTAFLNRPQLVAGKHMGVEYTTLEWAGGQLWRHLRKVTSLEIMGPMRLQTYASARSEGIHTLVSKLNEPCREGRFQTVDMKAAFLEVSLGTMLKLLTGRRYYGEKDGGDSLVKEFEDMSEKTLQLSATSHIDDLLPMAKWVGVNPAEKKMKRLMVRWNIHLQEIMKDHRRTRTSSSFEEGTDIIHVLLALQETNPKDYPDELIIGLIRVMITGATDALKGTLEWALTHLLNNPETLKKAVQEIEQKVGSSKLIDDSDLSSLPYLHTVLNETLRMTPPAPIVPPHESSEECIIGGYRVPRGTMLAINLWAMHNDPALWEEPEKFRPERFVEVKGQRDGYKFIPFSSGRRVCPGEGFAVRMIGLTLGTLLQCFEWERLSEEMLDMSIIDGYSLTAMKATPLVAKYRPRPTMMQLLSSM